MSLTISELEEQRAKILEEIESKAGKISPQNSNGSETPSLNDWLTAAEQVMPEPPKNKMQETVPKTNYSNKLLSDSKPSNKLSFFGVIIMLSLLLTVLGLIYIAYSSFQKEQEKVVESQNQNVEQLKILQEEVEQLKITNANLKKEALPKIANGTELTSNKESSLSKTTASVVTEDVLDEKLKAYTQTLESKIDHKLELILKQLNQDKDVKDLPGLVNSTLNSKKQLTEKSKTLSSDTITVPTVKEPELEMNGEIKGPTSPQAPIIATSADVNWLIAQPKKNFVLQLASVPNQKAAEKLISSKGLKDAKALPQTRNKETNYIVVTGSLEKRAEADKLAQNIKSNYGITPWIRNIEDLVKRVQ
ncbi:hypothetical protein JCM30760_13890 [Thiomicrorhabdus hydrogeniphila]